MVPTQIKNLVLDRSTQGLSIESSDVLVDNVTVDARLLPAESFDGDLAMGIDIGTGDHVEIKNSFIKGYTTGISSDERCKTNINFRPRVPLPPPPSGGTNGLQIMFCWGT